MVCETTEAIHLGGANLLLALQVVHFLLSGSCCSMRGMQLIAQLADLGCQVACLTVGPCIDLHAHHPNDDAYHLYYKWRVLSVAGTALLRRQASCVREGIAGFIGTDCRVRAWCIMSW